MSTRDYEKFAAIIAGEIALAEHRAKGTHSTDVLIGESARQTAVNIARSFADMAKQDNERFDRDKFYAACGLRNDHGFWS